MDRRCGNRLNGLSLLSRLTFLGLSDGFYRLCVLDSHYVINNYRVSGLALLVWGEIVSRPSEVQCNKKKCPENRTFLISQDN